MTHSNVITQIHIQIVSITRYAVVCVSCKIRIPMIQTIIRGSINVEFEKVELIIRFLLFLLAKTMYKFCNIIYIHIFIQLYMTII